MEYTRILGDAKQWIKDYIAKSNTQHYCFHDLVHTLDVVHAVELMADHYNLSERDRFVVLVAAYFHDLGYFTGGAAGHETRSVAIATDFLTEHQVDREVIDAISGCILATQLPQQPNNLLESILCDADLFHLGGENFQERDALMKQEYNETNVLKQREWETQTLALLENHRYHTDYAQQRLTAKKQQNIDYLKEQVDNQAASPGKKKKKEKSNRPNRGIETMFRVTSTNNQRLSDMADNKANILLTVNSIILSVIIALLVRKLNDNEHLAIPTFVLLMVSMTTIVVAILATRPKIPKGTFTPDDVDNKDVNLLFFGNFYKMGLSEYADGMRKVMEDRDFLYGTLTKDVYSQGVVLGRKYRLLRLAYNIFMFGMIIAVLTFIVFTLIYGIMD